MWPHIRRYFYSLHYYYCCCYCCLFTHINAMNMKEKIKSKNKTKIQTKLQKSLLLSFNVCMILIKCLAREADKLTINHTSTRQAHPDKPCALNAAAAMMVSCAKRNGCVSACMWVGLSWVFMYVITCSNLLVFIAVAVVIVIICFTVFFFFFLFLICLSLPLLLFVYIVIRLQIIKKQTIKIKNTFTIIKQQKSSNQLRTVTRISQMQEMPWNWLRKRERERERG